MPEGAGRKSLPGVKTLHGAPCSSSPGPDAAQTSAQPQCLQQRAGLEPGSGAGAFCSRCDSAACKVCGYILQ